MLVDTKYLQYIQYVSSICSAQLEVCIQCMTVEEELDCSR